MKQNAELKQQDNLWKYCKTEQIKELLRSFRLLEYTSIEEENYFTCLYTVSNHVETHYHSVVIPKKRGGNRKLSVPDTLLSRIQKNIVSHVLAELPVSKYATAYRRKSSVLENANPHVGANQILKLDMKDFFQNITFSMVYQNAFPAIYYPPAVRMLLTTLCCYKDSLPQGAPSSPAVSNLVMRPFDEYIGTWCEERQIHYTRYCDDMTFSGTFDQKELKHKVKSFLYVLGLELNEKKTRVQKQCHRQTVTGIVVNEKAQVSREYRKQLRAEIYYCQKYGMESHLQKLKENMTEQDAVPSWIIDGKPDTERYVRQLLGKINYVLQINPEDEYFRRKREELYKLE